MDNSDHTVIVRKHILKAFTAMGVDSNKPLRETILIQDGYYCGRRFSCDGYQAIWFSEENQVKYFDRDGSLLSTDDWSYEPTSESKAA